MMFVCLLLCRGTENFDEKYFCGGEREEEPEKKIKYIKVNVATVVSVKTRAGIDIV
jgi:hypothetical protein